MENTQKVDSPSSKKVSTSENLKIPIGYQSSDLTGYPNKKFNTQTKSCEIFSNKMATSVSDFTAQNYELEAFIN